MRMRIVCFWLALMMLLLLGACEEDDDPTEWPPEQPAVVAVYFDISDDADFYDAPFPIEHMRRADGTVRFDRFPNPADNFLVREYISQANRISMGFALGTPIHFRFDGLVNVDGLPVDWRDSLADDCPVMLVNIEPGSERYGERIALTADFKTHLDTFTPRYLMTLLPYQGLPMAADELYAAIVMRNLGDGYGRPLAVDEQFAAAIAGQWPEGEFAALDAPAFATLNDYLADVGINPDKIAAATVFRTGDPVASMIRLRDAVNALPAPQAEELSIIADYEDYYVVAGKFWMPIYQKGSRPYWSGDGQILFDASGDPILQWWEHVRFSVSVPKGEMPDEGWPLLFYANGQGGTYTQIFDRGPSASADPGEGPGKIFARRGIACLDIEAPLSGPRHPLDSYQGIEFFNPINLIAFRDNVRQSAAEFTFLIKLADNLALPADLCPEADAGPAESFFYDGDNFYFWGHSTGGSVGHLTLAVEPRWRAGMLSGAGVSWIYNVILKQQPLPIGEVMHWLLNSRQFNEYHPLMTIYQTATDGTEAANFDVHLQRDPLPGNRPKDFIVIGGYIDGFFPPLMIDGLAVAAGLDLAGEQVYPTTLTAIGELAGRGQVDLPVEDNIETDGRSVTGALLQYAAPYGMDGHYVAFRTNAPRHQYTCFFENIAKRDRARVPEPSDNVYGSCW